MMKKNRWMILLLASVLVACSSRTAQKPTVSEGVVKYDSLSVPIDYPYLGLYYQCTYYKEGNTLYWAGYNHWLHAIDVFDLTNRRTVGSYELEAEGPNAVLKNSISNFLANDSLFVFNCYSVGVKVLSRKDMKLCKTIAPLSAEEDYQLYFRGSLDGEYSGGFGMRWQEGDVLMPLFAKKVQAMEDALALSLNLSTSEAERLPIRYPEDMKHVLGKYGSLTSPFFTVGGDRIVYNFAYSSQVYAFLPETGEVRTFVMTSNATPNQSAPKDANVKERNFRENLEYERIALRFGEVYYDSDSDTYVRMHFGARGAMFDEQDAYLMGYRCKTDEVVEYELPEHFSTRYFVADGCVYILLKNGDDTHLHFAVIRL